MKKQDIIRIINEEVEIALDEMYDPIYDSMIPEILAMLAAGGLGVKAAIKYLKEKGLNKQAIIDVINKAKSKLNESFTKQDWDVKWKLPKDSLFNATKTTDAVNNRYKALQSLLKSKPEELRVFDADENHPAYDMSYDELMKWYNGLKKESVNEANLGDELWPEGDEEPDGEAIKKLLKPFYKVMMTSRYSRMETGHFDEAIKDYILDFMPELIKNKRDLVRDFKDHLETMGLWKKPINENEPINEGEETFDDLKKKAKKVKGYKNHGKFGFSIPYSYGDIEIEPIDKKHSAFNKERIRITWSSSDNTDSQVSPLSVGYNIVNKELKESVNENEGMTKSLKDIDRNLSLTKYDTTPPQFKITYVRKEDMSKELEEELVAWVLNKGGVVESVSNDFDVEDRERYYYPYVKFSFR